MAKEDESLISQEHLLSHETSELWVLSLTLLTILHFVFVIMPCAI
jgi:hypothetical protein